MSLRASYIGDKVTAAVMGLAGVRTYTPRPIAAEVWQTILDARPHADLVIIDEDYAELVKLVLTETTIAEPAPPMVRMPSLDRDAQPVNGAIHAARKVLGLEQNAN